MIVEGELFKPDLSVVGRLQRDTAARRRRIGIAVRTIVLLISVPVGAAVGGACFTRMEQGNWDRAPQQILGAFAHSAMVIGVGTLVGGSLLVKFLVVNEARRQAFNHAPEEHLAWPIVVALALLGTGCASVLGATYGWKATWEFSTPCAVCATLGVCAFLSAAWIAFPHSNGQRPSHTPNGTS